MKRNLTVALFALLTPLLPAQKIGSEAPDIAWERTFGFGDVESQRLSDLKGSVILLEFWTVTSAACIPEVPRLNKLFAEHGEAGLVVIGLSGDDPGLLPNWLKKFEVKYPCATATSKDYGVLGIPEAIVIDKDFKVAWRGHPAAIADAGLDNLLVGARPSVVVSGLQDVQLLRRGGDFGAAWTKARQLLDGGTLSERATTQAKEWLAKIEAKVQEAAAKAAEAETQGDIYGVYAALEPIASRYQGAPGADAAKAKVDKLMADPKVKKEIEAGRKVAEAKTKEAALDYDGAYEIYKAVAGSHGATKAGKAAAAQMKVIEKEGKLGYQASCPYCKASGAACPTHKKKKR